MDRRTLSDIIDEAVDSPRAVGEASHNQQVFELIHDLLRNEKAGEVDRQLDQVCGRTDEMVEEIPSIGLSILVATRFSMNSLDCRVDFYDCFRESLDGADHIDGQVEDILDRIPRTGDDR